MRTTRSAEQIPTNAEDQAFDSLIPRTRPAPDIHPLSTRDLEEEANRKWKKEYPTAHDSYVVFAWEYLRRNRFYQALVDKSPGHLPASAWGYRCGLEQTRGHGLIQAKPYWEKYEEGAPPAWLGLDSFAAALPTVVATKAEEKSIQLNAGQVAIIFDVAGVIFGQSPYDQQIELARERLAALCEGLRVAKIGGKPPHREVLVRRLKMFDLISAGSSLAEAAVRVKAATLGSGDPFSANNLRLRPPKPSTTSFDDATEAYNLVYRHGYAALLQGESSYVLNGNQAVPSDFFYRDEVRHLLKDW